MGGTGFVGCKAGFAVSKSPEVRGKKDRLLIFYVVTARRRSSIAKTLQITMLRYTAMTQDLLK